VICQCCGVESATKYVEFHQNIGALFARFHKEIKGRMCKSCINKYFWEFTLINLTLGWWGTISLLITPFFILNNLIRYLGTLKLPSVPAGAVAPILTNDVIHRLEPYQDELLSRINEGENLEQIAKSVAPRAEITPGQALLYIDAFYY
jgi:hypothetical protein